MSWVNIINTDDWNLYSDKLVNLSKSDKPIITWRKTIRIMDKFEYAADNTNATFANLPSAARIPIVYIHTNWLAPNTYVKASTCMTFSDI